MVNFYDAYISREKGEKEIQFGGINYELDQVLYDFFRWWWKGFIYYAVLLGTGTYFIITSNLSDPSKISVTVAFCTFGLICAVNSASKLLSFFLVIVTRNIRKLRIRSIDFHTVDDGERRQFKGLIDDYKQSF